MLCYESNDFQLSRIFHKSDFDIYSSEWWEILIKGLQSQTSVQAEVYGQNSQRADKSHDVIKTL